MAQGDVALASLSSVNLGLLSLEPEIFTRLVL